jgi:hypothetical protein
MNRHTSSASAPRTRSIVTVVFAAAFAGCVLAVACGGDVDAVHYGPSTGLTGKVPTTLAEGGAAAPPPTGGGNDSGSTASALCNGAGPLDGGTCAISWKKDIYPKMQPAGAWKCSDTTSCHGGKSGQVPPVIDPVDSHTAYMELVNYKSSSNGNKPYISPCTKSPGDSTFVCNVQPTGNCGILGMPSQTATPGAKALTTQEQADLLTWVQCAAPEN